MRQRVPPAANHKLFKFGMSALRKVPFMLCTSGFVFGSVTPFRFSTQVASWGRVLPKLPVYRTCDMMLRENGRLRSKDGYKGGSVIREI
jgi:hypothetical protein